MRTVSGVEGIKPHHYQQFIGLSEVNKVLNFIFIALLYSAQLSPALAPSYIRSTLNTVQPSPH